jgi:hypothetical protein
VSASSSGISRRAFIDLAFALLARPDLWLAAFGVVSRMAAPGWWRTAPYLPLPADRLWVFRMVTAYGDPDAEPAPEDLLSYLQWCRTTSRSKGSASAAWAVFSNRYRRGGR